MLVDGFLRFQRVLQIARQLFLLEQLLRIVMVIANPLIANAVNQREPLGAVDRFFGDVDELLRVPLEIGQSAAIREDFNQALSREVGLILKIGQQIGKLNVALVD